VGASAGGVEALRAFVGGLPGDLAVPVLVVLHLPSRAPSALPAILSRAGRLPAQHARDGETPRRGRIYVAPSDHHMLVRDRHLWLSNGPIENGHRPAIDPLFRSAARAYGPGVVGVVLSGALDDGTAGLATVVRRGGTALVQDPTDALHSSMPRSAIEHVDVDHIAPAGDLGRLVGLLTADEVGTSETAAPEPGAAEELLAAENEMAEPTPLTTDETRSRPSGLACPYCHGALFELDGAPVPRYRCRVGHAWSPQSLLEEQSEAFEGALWIALRALEEKGALSRRMAETARLRGSDVSAERYGRLSVEAERAVAVIRDYIRGLVEVGQETSGASAAVLVMEPSDP
jgi:two-component system chemotaxis response regulator CheB